MACGSTTTCDWVSDPRDKVALIGFFKSIQSRIGQGGSWDATALEEAAKFMAARGPPSKGAPKTVASIRSVWNTMKKVHDAILLVTQKQYPGASGWTDDQEHGFSICNDNKDEWKAFVKQHPVFRSFATSGWDLFDSVHDILRTRARDSSQLFFPDSQSQTEFSQSQSQPLMEWSQLQLTPLTLGAPPFAPSQPVSTLPSQPAAPAAAVSTHHRVIPTTPTTGMKRSASEHEETPWTKQGKIHGPDAIMALGKSVDNIGNALRDCFMPKESSAVSPTKQVAKARKLAEEEMEAGVITSEDRAILSLIFGSDPKKADAYVAEKDSAGRLTLAKILISRF
ncbi:hypothetical protein C8R45DRAFT_933147 [Mycena sanguinolenta]|nr:hypothetical protein C8R45DRAFT_933147 [Mycena sanguinolenta]